jgi:hypothetical protein
MNEETNIHKILSEIQTSLVAPKSQVNSFGKYKYRSCEDILEALKPLLKAHGASVLLNDEIVMLGNRFYVKAVASLKFGIEFISVSAYARESETKKGMDESQITGAASSYARKYALNALFAIDDTKDADANTSNGTASSGGTITEKQLGELRDMLIATNGDETKFCAWLKVESLDKLPESEHQKAFQALKAKVGK